MHSIVHHLIKLSSFVRIFAQSTNTLINSGPPITHHPGKTTTVSKQPRHLVSSTTSPSYRSVTFRLVLSSGYTADLKSWLIDTCLKAVAVGVCLQSLAHARAPIHPFSRHTVCACLRARFQAMPFAPAGIVKASAARASPFAARPAAGAHLV